MEKRLFWRVLSFVMVAILAFTLMSLSAGAEEVDIPTIEEVGEEELTEIFDEEAELELYAEGNVAKIGDVEYATLQAAINAVKNGETITLLSDVTFNTYIELNANKSFTIDGASSEGNYTIYDNAGTSNGFYIAYGHITFTNINIRKAPGNTTRGNNATFRLLAGGKVTFGDYAVLGGTSSAVAKHGNGGVVYASYGGGTFTLNGEGAKIEYIYSEWKGVFEAATANDTMEVNLLKGEIANCTTAKTGLIIANANTTVNLGNVVIINSQSPTVNGASVNAVNITGGGTLGTIKASSSKINFKKNLTYNTSETYTGGDFTGSVTLAITDETEPSSYANVESGMAVTGSVVTADGKALALDANGNLAEKKEVYVAKIGDIGYETLNAAINAVKNGETITLLSDITFSEQIKLEANKEFTINGANSEGNNYTIYDNTPTGSNGIYIAYGHITFTNINIRKAPENTAQGNNAAFRLLAGGGVTLGDYAVLGGTSSATAKYGNGGVVYASTASGNNRVDFTLNGEGARIEYLSSAWKGVFASNSANDVMEINLLKGEIVNCTGVDGLIVANANTTVNLGDVVITNSKTPTVKGDSVNAINITGGGTLGTIKAPAGKINFKKNLTYNTSETYAGGDFTGSAALNITDKVDLGSYALVEAGMKISGVTDVEDNLTLILDGSGTNLVKDYKAKIGNKGYTSLDAAIGAVVNGDTITLLEDITYTKQLKFENGKTFTISGEDGDGDNATNYTLKVECTTATSIQLAFNTKVTFENIFLTGHTAEENHAQGFVTLLDGTALTIGDYAVVGGTAEAYMAGGNGGVAWITGANAKFTLNGEGAKIQYVSNKWHGNISLRNATAEVHIINGTITNCKGAEGQVTLSTGGKIYISGGEISENTNYGVYVKTGTEGLELSGNAVINGNSAGNIYLAANTSMVIAGKYSGRTSVQASETATIKVSEGATLDNIDCFKSATDETLIPYINDGYVYWSVKPVLDGETDSGKYADGTGLIRFMTTFTKASAEAAVENFGTYALDANDFSEGMNVGSVTTFSKFIPGVEGAKAPSADGQAFIVDVVNIPENNTTNINAISFVKIKGIDKPIYYYYTAVNMETAAKNGVVKALGEKA